MKPLAAFASMSNYPAKHLLLVCPQGNERVTADEIVFCINGWLHFYLEERYVLDMPGTTVQWIGQASDLGGLWPLTPINWMWSMQSPCQCCLSLQNKPIEQFV